MFQEGPIEGVVIRSIKRYSDERGWLMEIFRKDEVDDGLFPQMTYISATKPGIARGPHEHIDQVDYFCFAGPSSFKIYLWDNREDSPTYRNRMVVEVGEENPSVVIVPEKVVHAYKNIGDEEGFVVNCPNRLFMGWDKKEPVDEVRYEEDENSPFKID